MPKPISEEKYKKAKQYYTTHKYQGRFTKQEFAERFGLSIGTAYKVINSHGYANYLNKYTTLGNTPKKRTKKEPVVVEPEKQGVFHKLLGLFHK